MMLSLSTTVLLIACNLIALVKSGPLDWARVEIPWARADRSELQQSNLIRFIFDLFHLLFSSYRRQLALASM